MSFSIIIPAYNEEDSIGNILKQLVRILDKTNNEYEIIVVNDGSTDRTKEEIIATGIPVILIDYPLNAGYGAAIKIGIKKARYENIVITDSDGTYPNDRIPELAALANDENLDMVVGARTGEKVRIPLVRRPAKWVITKLANYLTGKKIPDLNSGLRVMRKSIVNKYINILPDGFSFTTTITLAMLTNGYLVKYVPINYFKRKGRSKIRPMKDTLNFIQLIIRTVLYFNPLKVFVPLSLSLLIFAIFIFFGSWLFLGRAMDVSSGVVLMTAVMVMAIGMLADLIDKRSSLQ